jgi:hypothetical protein
LPEVQRVFFKAVRGLVVEPPARGPFLKASIRCHDDHRTRIPITRVPVAAIPKSSMPIAVMPVSMVVAAVVVKVVAPVRLSVLAERQ